MTPHLLQAPRANEDTGREGGCERGACAHLLPSHLGKNPPTSAVGTVAITRGPIPIPGSRRRRRGVARIHSVPWETGRTPPWPKCTRDSAWRVGFWRRERRWAAVSRVFNHTPLMGHQLIRVTERLLIKTNNVSLQTKPAPQWLHQFRKESRLEGEHAEYTQGVVTSHT